MRKINEDGKLISDEKLRELKENARGILAEDRRSLINDFPFYGSVAMNMEIVPTRDVRLPTAACDGRTIFFDIDFLSSLSPEHRKFILGHEIMHAIMATALRCEGREHEQFNIASDMEINQILQKDGLCVPPDALLPEKRNLPKDQSAEQYYEILTSSGKNQKNDDSNGNSSSGMPGGSDGNGSQQPSDDEQPQNNSGNKNGELKGQFDKHLTKNDNIDAELTPDNVCDKYGKVGTDKDYRPDVCESNAEKMREAAITAAQVYERQRGDLPEHLKKLVEDLTKPEISWKEVLQSFVTRTIGSEADWNRPNRRFVSSRVYLPSHDGETVKIGVILDTSGSTANDIPKFLGEVNGIVSAFSGYTLTIVQCDTEVKSCETYDDDNPLDLETTKFEVCGGGGTIINPAFKHFEENDIDVDAVVCFTDGFTETFTEDMDPGYPVLWMVTKGGKTDTFEFGEVCEFNED